MIRSNKPTTRCCSLVPPHLDRLLLASLVQLAAPGCWLGIADNVLRRDGAVAEEAWSVGSESRNLAMNASSLVAKLPLLLLRPASLLRGAGACADFRAAAT